MLSEPSTLRQAQGERWVEAPVLSEPFVPSRASLRARLRPGRAHPPEGGPTGPEAGRTVSRRAQHEREDLQCLYNYGPINKYLLDKAGFKAPAISNGVYFRFPSLIIS